jgi:hypothetical protein
MTGGQGQEGLLHAPRGALGRQADRQARGPCQEEGSGGGRRCQDQGINRLFWLLGSACAVVVSTVKKTGGKTQRVSLFFLTVACCTASESEVDRCACTCFALDARTQLPQS